MTITLSPLGRIDLRDEAGEELRSLLTQPKRLALLIYLASTSTSRLCRRDSLLAMCWPESDTERARAALRQALHFIRQAAASDIVITRGADEIGLQPGAVFLDSAQFETLANEGRDAEAVTAYHGDFLDAFSVRGVPEFDRWVSGERDRLRQRVAECTRNVDRHAAATEEITASAGRTLISTPGVPHAKYRMPAMRTLGIALLVVIAMSYLLAHEPWGHQADVDPNRIASHRSSSRERRTSATCMTGSLCYWSTRLDGIVNLHAVDMRAVLLEQVRRGADSLTLESAAKTANNLGAGPYIVGHVVGTQGHGELAHGVALLARAVDGIRNEYAPKADDTVRRGQIRRLARRIHRTLAVVIARKRSTLRLFTAG